MPTLPLFVDTYLHLDTAEMRTFRSAVASFHPPEKEAVMEWTTSWKEEGRHTEACALVARQLRRKVGASAEAVQARLEPLSIERLEELSEALLDFTAPADFDAWLDKHRDERKAVGEASM